MGERTLQRRDLLKTGAGAALLSGIGGICAADASPSRVWRTEALSAEGFLRAVAAVKGQLAGRIAVKFHTGEPHGPNILPTEWVKAVIDSLPNAVLIETNTAYGTARRTTTCHRETLKTNGWTFSEVDILDADGGIAWPVRNGLRLKEIKVGKHLENCDSMLVLTHFKGPSGLGRW